MEVWGDILVMQNVSISAESLTNAAGLMYILSQNGGVTFFMTQINIVYALYDS